MSEPTLKVEIAFTATPFADSHTWTDVTHHVRGDVQWQRGRNHTLQRTEAGTLALTLDNTEGDFTPENTDSVHYPYVTINAPIRVSAVIDGETKVRWRGFVERWTQTFAGDGSASYVQVTGVDAFRSPILSFEFGQRFDEYIDSLTDPDIWFRFDDAAGGPGTNQGTNSAWDGNTTSGMGAGSAPSTADGLVLGNTNASTLYSAEAVLQNSYAVRMPTALVDADTVVIIFEFGTTDSITVQQELRIIDSVGPAGPSQNNSYELIAIVPTSGSPYLQVKWYDNAGSATTANLASETLTLGTPDVFAVVTDVSTKKYVTYRNGVQIHDTGVLATAPSGQWQASEFGGMTTATTGYGSFQYWLDELLTFDGMLTAAQLLRIADYVAGDTAEHAEFRSEIVPTRIGNVLDVVDWPAADRVLDAGGVTLAATGSLSGSSARDVIQEAGESEHGNVFIDAQGRVVYHEYAHLAAETDPQITFGDAGGEARHLFDYVIDYDDTNLYNHIEVTVEGSSPAQVLTATNNAANLAQFGKRTLRRSHPYSGSSDATTVAGRLLDQFGEPHQRVDRISVQLKDNDRAVELLDLEIGEWVRCNRRPNADQTITVNTVITGVTETVTPVSWVLTLQMAPKVD